MIMYNGGCDFYDLDDVYVTEAEEELLDQGWNNEEFVGSTASFLSRSFLEVEFLMKLFNENFCNSERAEVRFERERKALEVCTENDLSGFPRLYGSGEIEDQYYLTMNFFKGPNVLKLIYSDFFDSNEFIPYLPQLADDVGRFHEVGFIHHDIKPGNLLLLPDGFRIVDMGIAFPFEDGGINNKVHGTPGYISPENIKKRKLTPASDVYSLGMTLYVMLAGGHPLEGNQNFNEIFDWQLNKMPRPLVKVADVSGGLSDVVMKALAKDPEKRYRNGKEMADALAGVC